MFLCFSVSLRVYITHQKDVILLVVSCISDKIVKKVNYDVKICFYN